MKTTDGEQMNDAGSPQKIQGVVRKLTSVSGSECAQDVVVLEVL